MIERSAGTGTTGAATAMAPAALGADLEKHRIELTAYCYRMLGSIFEAEDAAQETMIRAWRGLDRFEGRSSLRSWMYRIATNVCFDALKGRQRRATPIDLGPASTTAMPLAPPLAESTWVEPAPDSRILPERSDPADVAVSRDSVRLAFIAALQHLPPRQRAVLILRDVLRWQAKEVAELLDTTVASVNSALQRAHAAFADGEPDLEPPHQMDAEHKALLSRYVEAFERYDIDALVKLLHEDATQTMPPYPMWLQGADEVGRWMLGPGAGCEGSRLLPVNANGVQGFAQYRRSPDGGHEPWAIQVHHVENGRFAALNFYLDTARLFPLFGLPPRLDP